MCTAEIDIKEAMTQFRVFIDLSSVDQDFYSYLWSASIFFKKMYYEPKNTRGESAIDYIIAGRAIKIIEYKSLGPENFSDHHISTFELTIEAR